MPSAGSVRAGIPRVLLFLCGNRAVPAVYFRSVAIVDAGGVRAILLHAQMGNLSGAERSAAIRIRAVPFSSRAKRPRSHGLACGLD